MLREGVPTSLSPKEALGCVLVPKQGKGKREKEEQEASCAQGFRPIR